MSRQRGFTLIELVVVIVILSILAAIALPRYTSLQTQARIAKLNGAHGAVAGAMAMTHGACLAIQDTTPLCSSTNAPYNMRMEGLAAPVTMILQYPTADQPGIVNAAGITLATADSSQGYAVTGGGAAPGSTVTIEALGGGDPANCSFGYTSASGTAGSTLVPAQIGNLTISGC